MSSIPSPIVEEPVEPTGHDSRIRLVLRRFLRRRLAIAGFVIVLMLFAFAYIGPHF
jgi:N-terminal TM domain of oligopeptide transport permease C